VSIGTLYHRSITHEEIFVECDTIETQVRTCCRMCPHVIHMNSSCGFMLDIALSLQHYSPASPACLRSAGFCAKRTKRPLGPPIFRGRHILRAPFSKCFSIIKLKEKTEKHKS